jgi:hypothetical protein
MASATSRTVVASRSTSFTTGAGIALFPGMDEQTLEVGHLCMSKDPIIKTLDDEKSRICRVVADVPRDRWRNPGAREVKVELIVMPVTAFVREDRLVPLT